MAAAGVPAGSIPQCALHPGSPASAVCERCGGFCCDPCATRVSGEPFCTACAALPEVNYLEALRARFWGRPDAWAWLLGLGGVLSAAVAFSTLGSVFGAARVVSLANAVVSLGYAFRQRWARWGLLGLPLVTAAWALLAGAPLLAVPCLVSFGFGLMIFLDVRSQLFLRIPQSEARLRGLWDLYENNLMARNAVSLGVLGLVVPFFAPLALALGVVGLRRVDPRARPPIGRKGQALVGIVLGAVGVVGWGVILGLTFLPIRSSLH